MTTFEFAMKRFCAASLLLAGLAPAGLAHADNKILLGPHIGDATIIEIDGVDSDRARVRFRRELDDEIETCVREGGQNRDSKDVARCVNEGARSQAGKVYARRAFCSRLTIYTEFGNFSMIDHEKEKESVFDGKPYRPIRTDWKDHRTGEIVGNCSACNIPQMLSTLKVLCPARYDQMFRGFNPY